MRFNVTWSNFVRALKRLDDIAQGKTVGRPRLNQPSRMGSIDERIELLRKYVDIAYQNKRIEHLSEKN